eukprot:CAMPEP_0206432582 /NCGR_PEP_ID=MMETSP0324_2-20121206/8040_1 /ASSEMBLY_ACC=CAM_ASM_000836 /TAXON_ID=2866 /ORGANISM="Crypthecodinium cohnii, Strain Seligo" /LENGTH=250 /DNA_ID=CAMNT_0053898717 /DNA_START=1058 /DNA_END=1807 /DNA_ORIENTATION=-
MARKVVQDKGQEFDDFKCLGLLLANVDLELMQEVAKVWHCFLVKAQLMERDRQIPSGLEQVRVLLVLPTDVLQDFHDVPPQLQCIPWRASGDQVPSEVAALKQRLAVPGTQQGLRSCNCITAVGQALLQLPDGQQRLCKLAGSLQGLRVRLPSQLSPASDDVPSQCSCFLVVIAQGQDGAQVAHGLQACLVDASMLRFETVQRFSMERFGLGKAAKLAQDHSEVVETLQGGFVVGPEGDLALREHATAER